MKFFQEKKVLLFTALLFPKKLSNQNVENKKQMLKEM